MLLIPSLFRSNIRQNCEVHRSRNRRTASNEHESIPSPKPLNRNIITEIANKLRPSHSHRNPRKAQEQHNLPPILVRKDTIGHSCKNARNAAQGLIPASQHGKSGLDIRDFASVFWDRIDWVPKLVGKSAAIVLPAYYIFLDPHPWRGVHVIADGDEEEGADNDKDYKKEFWMIFMVVVNFRDTERVVVGLVVAVVCCCVTMQ